jgi:hypothetical protein
LSHRECWLNRSGSRGLSTWHKALSGRLLDGTSVRNLVCYCYCMIHNGSRVVFGRGGGARYAAAVLRSLGTPPRYEQFPDPVPGEGETIVQVRAAPQNMSTSNWRAARISRVLVSYRLSVAQTDLAVSATARVTSSGQLDRRTRWMAEQTLVRRQFCFPVPDNVSDETAATLPNPGVSAGVDTQPVPLADVEKAWQGEPRGHKRRSTMYCDNPFLFLSVLSAGACVRHLMN